MRLITDTLPKYWMKEYEGNVKNCEFCGQFTFARFVNFSNMSSLEERVICVGCDSKFVLLLQLGE